MKNLLFSAIVFAAAAGFACEREDLLSNFKKENLAAKERFQQAFTTIELTAAAGNSQIVAEKQLLRALDYKLKNTPDSSERLQMLSSFYDLSREVQKIHDTPDARLTMGSLANMHIYHRIACLMQHQIEILMLDDASGKRWKKIADAVLVINDEKIKLNNGRADFEAEMYGQKELLETIIYPHDVFSYNNRDWVLVRTDIPFAGNNDFSTLYLCELKQDKLIVHTKCKLNSFTKFELQNGKLTIYDRSEHEVVLLQ